MERVSYSLPLFAAYLNTVLSLALVGLSILIHFMYKSTLCVKVLEKPSLIVGVTSLLVWIIGLVRSLCRAKLILWICTILLSLFYLGLFCFDVFSVLVTNRDVSRAVFGRDGYYSHYLLEKYVMNAEQIKNCLVDFETCHPVPAGEGADSYKYSLSHTQWSCCNPPTYCGLEFQSAAHWSMPKAGLAVADDDCKIWSNEQTKLCFYCQSCKTTFYSIINKYWMILSLMNFVILLFVCGLSCCIHIINNRSKGHLGHKVYPI